MAWIQSPMVDFLEKQLINNPEGRYDIGFALRPENNLTKVYEHDKQYRIKIPKKGEIRPQRNLVIEGFSTAKTGTGKSTLFVGEAWSVMSVNYPNYDAEKFVQNHVHFTVADFKQGVKEFKDLKASIHMIDETRKAEALGIGSTAMLSKVSDVISVCRIKGLSAFRIMSSEHRYRTINPHYRIDVNKINFEEEANLSLIQDNDLKYRGHIITRRPKIKELWKAYDAKKDEFVEETLSDEHDERFGIYQKMAQELANDEQFTNSKNKQDMMWHTMRILGSEYPKSVLNLVINQALNLIQNND